MMSQSAAGRRHVALARIATTQKGATIDNEKEI